MIKYINGDATMPNNQDMVIIPHVCNDIGGWGSGFVIALSNKWREPERSYRQWFMNKTFTDITGTPKRFELGAVQFVQVEPNIIVANMIGQSGIYSNQNVPPIRYQAVRKALHAVDALAVKLGATIHAPMFGAGLAGGDWKTIEDIINETLTTEVTVYQYAPNENDIREITRRLSQ